MLSAATLGQEAAYGGTDIHHDECGNQWRDLIWGHRINTGDYKWERGECDNVPFVEIANATVASVENDGQHPDREPNDVEPTHIREDEFLDCASESACKHKQDET